MLRSLLCLGLVTAVPAEHASSQGNAGGRLPAESSVALTLRLNGKPVQADTSLSRIEVSSGTNQILTFNIVRADLPDDPGLTIILDQFRLVPGTYRFREILSGHVRDASYRAGTVVAYSNACGRNEGIVQILRVDRQHHQISGTFSCMVCDAERRPGSPRRQLALDGQFRFPYSLP